MIQVLNKLTEAEKAELKAGVIQVSAKAKNRTALGIVASVFQLFPKVTFQELKEILPDEINPESTKMFRNLFNPYYPGRLCGVVQPSTVLGDLEAFNAEIAKNGYYFNAEGKRIDTNDPFGGVHFSKPEERFVTSDGIEVLVASHWSDAALQRLVDHVAAYGIRVVEFQPKEGSKRGEYYLEVLNPALLSALHGTDTPQQERKSNFWPIIGLAILLLAAIGLYLWKSGRLGSDTQKPDPSPTSLADIAKDLKNEIEARDKELGKRDSALNSFKAEIREALAQFDKEELAVEQKAGKLYIVLQDNLVFSSGSVDVQPSGKRVILKVAEVLKKNPAYDIEVEGHTDNQPVKSKKYADNWDISSKRAQSVVHMLTEAKINPKRIVAVGRGEFDPKATNATEAGRAKNRRTEIIIAPNLDKLYSIIE